MIILCREKIGFASSVLPLSTGERYKVL